MNVLCLIPRIFGSSGDAVNERQLIFALSKKVRKIYLLTFVDFPTFKREVYRLKKTSEKLIIIPILIPGREFFVGKIIMTIVSLLLTFVMSMLILFKLLKIEIIYVRTSHLAIGLLFFNKLAKKTIVKIPTMIEDDLSNNSIIRFFVSLLTSCMDKLVIAKAARIAVNSITLYKELVKRRLVLPKHRPLEIPPGIELRLIEKIKSQKYRGFSKDALNIGFIGSLFWWQGVEILVSAVDLLKKKIPDLNLKLMIIGDGPLRSLIEEQCKKLNVSYEITGYLPHADVLRYLSMVDVMVLPSRKMSTTETNIPIKVIEAWALGIPVVATKRKVFVDYGIRDMKDIVYCEPNPQSVAEAIEKVITNPELRMILIENGYRLAENFNYEKIAEKLIGAIADKKDL